MEAINIAHELQKIKYNLFKEQNPETGLFDVIFEIDERLLYAHKPMLNLVSTTFASMLSDRWSTKDEPIKIKEYSYADFYQFITFLYSGQSELTDENIYAMVDMAEYYGVNLFKTYCEQYLPTMEITVENVFELLVLANKFSIKQLRNRVKTYILNNFTKIIKSGGLLNVSKVTAKKLVAIFKDKAEPEDLFEAVYEFCEKQAIDKLSSSSFQNFNDLIKTEISDFLPFILFREMELKFMHDFIIPRGFIFSSLKELSKIFGDREQFFEGKVKITNDLGETLHGKIISEKTVLRNIESIKLLKCYFAYNEYCWWNTKCPIPSTPSPLKKRDDIEWYLVYFWNGNIAVVHCTSIDKRHYLLAELTAGDFEFQTAYGCQIQTE